MSKENEEKVTSPPEPEAEEQKSKPEKTRTDHQRIVSSEGRLGIKTDAEKEKDDFLDLKASMQSKKLLTDEIIGVENPGNGEHIVAVLYHGSYKVIIPDTVFVVPSQTEGVTRKAQYDFLLRKHLGTTIDYIITAIDDENKVAVGDHLAALRIQQKRFYIDIQDETGTPLIKIGTICQARVISVIRSGIFVDICGVETFIGLKELTYARLFSASSVFSVGDLVFVKILDIVIENKEVVSVKASVKRVKENPAEAAMKKYKVGSSYLGIITGIASEGVYVCFEEGVDCLCMLPRGMRPPIGSKVCVVLRGTDPDRLRLWGVIVHVIRMRQ